MKFDHVFLSKIFADGADWIWDIVRLEFGSVHEYLDVYHALEHLSRLGKLFYGEGTAAYQQWYEWTQQDLLSGGFALLEDRLAGLSSEERTAGEREFLRRLRDYFRNHSDRLCYRERLLEGRAMGSGEVEGACKSMIGRRLKQTGARWKVRRLNRMTTLCTLRYSSLWKNYWKYAK